MEWEINFLKWVWENLHAFNFINEFFKYLTAAGDSWYPYVWQAVICITLTVFKKTRKTGIVLAFCLLFWGVLVNSTIIKNTVQRPRPFLKDDTLLGYVQTVFNQPSGSLALPDSFSFMSGHTTNAFILATVVSFYHRKATIPMFVYASLMSFSRLFFGVHYPTDVIAGAIFATGVSIGSCYLANYLEQRLIICHNKKAHANTN